MTRRTPLAYVSCSYPQSERSKRELVRQLYDWHGFAPLRSEIAKLLTRLGVMEELTVHAVLYRKDDDDYVIIAVARAKNGTVVIEDPWREFPSEEFQAKLRMIA